ncbi:hypothetical protein Tco_0080414, partial [Tanacetum coccineum]
MEMHNAFNQQYGYRPHMSPSPNPIPSQSSQRFSPLNSLDIEDDEFAPLFGEGPSQPVVQDSPDESPVEEVAPVKRKYVRKRQPAKKNDKDVNEPWTPDEEAALCKAWINTSENNKDGNGKKTNGFWMEGQLLWKTVLSWRTVECKFNGKITVVILVRDRCPREK